MDKAAAERLGDVVVAYFSSRTYRTNLPPSTPPPADLAPGASASAAAAASTTSGPAATGAAAATEPHAKRPRGGRQDGGRARQERSGGRAAPASSSSVSVITASTSATLSTPTATLNTASTVVAIAGEMVPEEEVPQDVTITQDGQYELRLPVQKRFFGSLIGKQGATLRALQERTGAKVTVPERGSRDTAVTVRGERVAQVEAARVEIHQLVADAAERGPPTHFVSLPLDTPALRTAVASFLDDLCAGNRALDAFRVPVESFHLTVGVLKLFEEPDVLRAKNALATAGERASALLKDLPAHCCPPQIHVAGLGLMQANPTKANVLYAKACMAGEEEGGATLQNIMNSVRDAFVEEGLMPRSDEPVKIHATLLNTRHANTKRKQSFDASVMLEALGDHDFGSAPLGTLHLSRMQRKPGEYYTAEATVPLV